jgi:hypothetical protein
MTGSQVQTQTQCSKLLFVYDMYCISTHISLLPVMWLLAWSSAHVKVLHSVEGPVYVHVQVHVCVCVCLCEVHALCMPICACIYVYMYIYIYIYMYIYLYVYIYIYIYTSIYTTYENQ